MDTAEEFLTAGFLLKFRNIRIKIENDKKVYFVVTDNKYKYLVTSQLSDRRTSYTEREHYTVCLDPTISLPQPQI